MMSRLLLLYATLLTSHFGAQSSNKTTSLLSFKPSFLILQVFYLDIYVYGQYIKSFEKCHYYKGCFPMFFCLTMFQWTYPLLRMEFSMLRMNQRGHKTNFAVFPLFAMHACLTGLEIIQASKRRSDFK